MNYTVVLLVATLWILCFYYIVTNIPIDSPGGSYSLDVEEDIVPWEFSTQYREYLNTIVLTVTDENIKNDDNYCKYVENYQKSRKIELDANGLPEKKYRFIFSDYSPGLLLKEILREIAVLANPKLIGNKDFKDAPLEELDPKIDIFFHLKPAWHQVHQIERHFLCENQRYNHIPGNLYLNFKDIMANSMRKYAKNFVNREKCFEPWEIMPETFDMYDKVQCLEFADRVNSSNSTEIDWILKISRYSHNGEGLILLDPATAKNIANEPNGCPFKNKLIVQKYIKNTLLINKHKFDFRAYLIIANMDPLILLYHDGYVKFSIEEYDLDSLDLAVHLTNTNIAKQKANTLNNSEEIMQDQSWSFKKFTSFMENTGKVDENWISQFRGQIKAIMLHCVKMNLDKLLHHPRVFEMFGFDFMLDENMHLWYLETNLTPSISSSSDEKKEVNTQMIKKLIDIQYALIYNVSIDGIIGNSGFEWIYDGRKKGGDRYCGVISEECF